MEKVTGIISVLRRRALLCNKWQWYWLIRLMTECSNVAFDMVCFIGDSYWFNKLKLSVSYMCMSIVYELKLNCICAYYDCSGFHL